MSAFATVPFRMSAEAAPSTPATSPTSAGAEPRSAKYTLHSIPISFFAARCRLLIYREPLLASSVSISAPPDGSMKSAQHLAINPLGKIPSLISTDLADEDVKLFESQVIVDFLLDRFGLEAAYTYATPELRARVRLIGSFVDSYMVPLQASLYRAMPADTRAEQIAQLRKQIDVLEGLIDAAPYAVGDQLTLADVHLFGVFILYAHIGPIFFRFRPNDPKERPKLTRWFETMCEDPSAQRTRGEVQDALDAWRTGGRWEKLGVPEDPLP